jgi:hypothetical protein
MKKCMVTENNVADAETNNLVITHRGQPIGVVSVEGLTGVRTLRLTFTRDSETQLMSPVQGQCLEVL